MVRFHSLLVLLMSLHTYSARAAAREMVDLVDYARDHVVAPDHDEIPNYNRLKQFGEWIIPNAESCMNTRHRVLLRDADPDEHVTIRRDGCAVSRAVWHDIYAGDTFEKPQDVQVDHVVPLANAYYSGAYRWATARRCHYANFLDNAFHLRAVSGTENMKKGSDGPEGYMPPKVSSRCQYLQDWMKIKTIWQLTSTRAEVTAIDDELEKNNCAASFRKMAASELEEQRAISKRPIDRCVEYAREIESGVIPERPPRAP